MEKKVYGTMMHIMNIYRLLSIIIQMPELNYKTGVSALFSDKKEEAAGFFLKAFELKKDVAEDVLLLTGRALQYSGRFSEAIEKFTAYLSSPGKKSEKNISAGKKVH